MTWLAIVVGSLVGGVAAQLAMAYLRARYGWDVICHERPDRTRVVMTPLLRATAERYARWLTRSSESGWVYTVERAGS